MYEHILKPVLFLLPPEWAHGLGLCAAQVIGILYRLRLWPRKAWMSSKSTESPFGRLRNPVGLAAGSDKNGKALWGWEALGFGFVEVGTVTPRSQTGNSKPRLFRLEGLRGLLNRMGFNNDGAHAVAERVKKAKSQGLQIKVGGNIGKNFNTDLDLAHKDYALAALALRDCVDYLVINVSSPNTPGLRDLQSEESLERIVAVVRSAVGELPVFIKVSPDHFESLQPGLLRVIEKFKIEGLICGNTTTQHDHTSGGLSGPSLFPLNLKLCSSYFQRKSDLFLIGVGGIEGSKEASDYFRAGAKLVQVYTGFVYRGPTLIKDVVVGAK